MPVLEELIKFCFIMSTVEDEREFEDVEPNESILTIGLVGEAALINFVLLVTVLHYSNIISRLGVLLG